ncbi:Exopolyphosphatase [Handroanthus impetiginosus]|uniref:Exopolyphosphatase n=1 Tax=Handroanthus impetiginosus TaxID=429701 RepID=A0A2G9GGA9_9LAMI|nr:Exopolyphosphatase [Handroanthus impetiginosus]
MSGGLPFPPPAAATATTNNNLFATVDMGTNSFKLIVVRTDPSSGRFLTINRLKEPVLLGLDTTTTSAAATISAASMDRAISAIRNFHYFLKSYRLPPSHLRLVATSAVREASNNSQFITAVNEALGLHVEVLSGAEEARLIYLGVLQFFTVFTSTILTIDIGGGSTEFTVGFKGNVLFSKSLRLGHVTLTQEFSDITKMREHIRSVLESSGLIAKIKEFKLDAVIGSSGTIKAIERAVCKGYALKVEENIGTFDVFVKREWKFTRHELKCLVERLYDEEREGDGNVRRVGFFKERAAFILAGSVLLEEVFESLGVEEIEVSGHALAEGVITEMVGQVFKEFDLNVNARWRSVVRLASRFNNKKRMNAATVCASVAREIFEGLKKLNEPQDHNEEEEVSMSLDDKDLEYLDAACLLHNIGLYTGKKGYHKQSYHIITNGHHLHGYTEEEIKLIALLVRYHRKKFPKSDVLEGSKEVKQRFRILCTILRVSYALQQGLPVNFQFVEFIRSPEGFKLVLSVDDMGNRSPDILQSLSGGINASVEKELEHLRMVLKLNLSVLVTASIDGQTANWSSKSLNSQTPV